MGRGVLRGVALFFGAFSAVNAAVFALGARRSEDLWWVEYGFLPDLMAIAVGVSVSVLLVAFALAPAMSRVRRWLTVAACIAVTVSALVNATDFYRAWAAGTIAPAAPVPFSVVIAVVFACVAWGVAVSGVQRASGSEHVALGISAISLMLVFPLAQVAFFGTTDYRAPARVVVVPGALVYADGTLSRSLEDRVLTAVELYREGLADELVMSGGVGASGVDEAVAMKRRAVELGVPACVIAVDSKGVNTDATVANTIGIGRPGTMLVVSQFYHLPRIKLAYRAAGRDVRTVPAQAVMPIVKTPLFVAREIPGFWVYWARAALRDVRG